MNAQKRKMIALKRKITAQKRKEAVLIKRKWHEKRRECNLEPGMKGFFCAYWDFYEDDCIREAYNVLSEFADNLYGPESKSSQTLDKKAATAKKASGNRRGRKSRIDDTENEEEEENISTALKKEVTKLKAESNKPVASSRFEIVETGVECVVFMRTTLSDPLELVSTIVQQFLNEKRKEQIMFLMRLLPVELICEAKMDVIKLKVDPLLGKYFTADQPKTFAVAFNMHNNCDLLRNRVLDELFDIIVEKNPGNKPDLINPEIGVVVEVIRGVCLISIAPYYYKYKKYDLREICRVMELCKKEPAVAPPPVSANQNPEKGKKEPAKKVEPARERKMNAEAEIASGDK